MELSIIFVAIEGAFSSFTMVTDGECLFMGNDSSSKIEGKGTVTLIFNSGNVLSLKGVLCVPDIRKYLMFGFILVKKGFKIVFESGQVVLFKISSFVKKGYVYKIMFKLNICVSNNKASTSSVYLLDSYDL